MTQMKEKHFDPHGLMSIEINLI